MKHGYFPGWDEHKNVEVMGSDGITRVIVKGRPYMTWDSGDEASNRMAIVQLYECGLCTVEDLSQVFELTRLSQFEGLESWKSL